MTPLEITIAIHYWCFPGPYKGGSENWTQLECKIVQDMLNRHLLEHNHEPNALSSGRALTGNTPAMRCFIEAIQAVPWPRIKWVCDPSPVTQPGEPAP